MSAPLFIVKAPQLLLAVYAHGSGAAASMHVNGGVVVVVVVLVVVVDELVVVAAIVVVALHCVILPDLYVTAPLSAGGLS
jgi:hypothetical protein